MKNELEQCKFCFNLGRKEIVSDVARETNTKDEVVNPHYLVWLYPDEKWICNKCLRHKTQRMQIF